MPLSEHEIQQLLKHALAGDKAAMGSLLQGYRPLLAAMAREQLPGDLKPRIGESDVVQASCLSAIRSFENFVGNEPAEFIAWLKTIHQQNLKDIKRDHIGRENRSIHRETHDPDLLIPDGNQRTASGWTILHEDRQAVLAALSKLPQNQAQVIRMRHMDGMKLKQIAEEIQRTPAAVAGLLKRGLKTLREQFDNDQ